MLFIIGLLGFLIGFGACALLTKATSKRYPWDL